MATPEKLAGPKSKRHAEILLGAEEAKPLLGILRERVLLKATSGENRLATSEEISTWLMKTYQENALLGDIYQAVMTLREDYAISPKQLPTNKAAFEQMYALEHYPVPQFFFVSTSYQEEPVGFLFHREALEGGGRVYSATGFFPHDASDKVSKCDFRIHEADPEPFVSVMTSNEWIRISKGSFSENEYLDLAFKCLTEFCNYLHPRIDATHIIDNRTSKPKDNEYLVNLIAEGFKGSVQSTRVSLPISRIKPRDLDYTLNIPEIEIQSFMRRVADWGAPLAEIVLYEENGQLIMDDDYVVYCAYRALEVKTITGVVIGDFDESGIKVLARGFGELIPPITVSKEINGIPTQTISKEERLNQKLLSLAPDSNSKASLRRKFTDFCRLLGRDSTLEKDLHKFIGENPQIFDCHFGRMHMEVPIGDYRADMVLEYDQSHRRILLVELERHVDQIFTKDNRLRSKVTHAGQQVEDWIGEIRAGKTNIPDWLTREYVVEGAVVIGRSKNLTLKQRETLRIINTNRTIKIMTYDDLLEQMMRMISML